MAKKSRAEVSICSKIVPLNLKKKRQNHHCFDLKRNNNANIHYHIKHEGNSKLSELMQPLQSAVSETAGGPKTETPDPRSPTGDSSNNCLPAELSLHCYQAVQCVN